MRHGKKGKRNWNLKEKTYGYIFFWRKKKKKKKEKFRLKTEIKDWTMAFIVAAVVYFVLLPAALSTASPGVVVSSCSERGYLNVGDILILQGTSIEDVRAPLVEVDSFNDFRPLLSPVDGNFETTALDIGGKVVYLNRSNDIVVYVAYPTGMQIIHRAFAKVKAGNQYYLITKGDANKYPDQWSINGVCITENVGCISTVITQKMVVGKQVFFGIPLLGHVKLFFCDLTFGLLCEGHANAGTDYQYTLTC
jgi:signal peptidase I